MRQSEQKMEHDAAITVPKAHTEHLSSLGAVVVFVEDDAERPCECREPDCRGGTHRVGVAMQRILSGRFTETRRAIKRLKFHALTPRNAVIPAYLIRNFAPVLSTLAAAKALEDTFSNRDG